LFALFQLIGVVFFSILIGPKLAGRPSLRTHKVVVGGILFMAALGTIAGFVWDNPEWVTAVGYPHVVAAALGGLAGLLLSWILLAYVSAIEEEEWRRKREEERRQERIAKGLGPAPDKSCFIATTVFGSAEAVEVAQLRAWRDGRLLPSPLGRFVVGLYYAVSPRIANFIEYTHLKSPARFLLRRFIVLLHRYLDRCPRTSRDCFPL
jgi:MFS family permease